MFFLLKKTTEDIATANNKNKALSDQVNRDILTLRNEAKSFKEFFSDLSVDKFTTKIKSATQAWKDMVSTILSTKTSTYDAIGTVIEKLGRRKAEMVNMEPAELGHTKVEFKKNENV